jgi:G:T/U-mismatch repair DNA glycosylase
MQQKSDSHCSQATIRDLLALSAPFTCESLFCCTLFPKGKTKKPRVKGSQDLPSPTNRFWKSMQQKSDSRCSRANAKDPLKLSAPFTFESLFCCTLFLKGKTKKPRVQGPQDLPSPTNRFWKSLQQKNDSHCFRANPEDHPIFLAPLWYESLFCCALFPKGKTKNLRVQGSLYLPSPTNRFWKSMQQKSDSDCSRANVRDDLWLFAP